MKQTTINATEPSESVLQCPNCDSISVQNYHVMDRFKYGVGEQATELSVEVPAHRCLECKLEFTGEEAERRRHHAVCDHLRLLRPSEVVQIRARYGLSRAKFAAVSKIGMATLARWENGEKIQNAAMDVYLRLLSHREVYERVITGEIYQQAVEHTEIDHSVRAGRFRHLPDLGSPKGMQLTQRSNKFLLQGAATG